MGLGLAKSNLNCSLLAGAAMALVLLSGCAAKNDYTGSVNPAVATNTPGSTGISEELLQNTAKWAEKYRRKPKDAGIAINYARHLRAIDRSAEAVGVLQQARTHHPQNRDILGELGKALAASGAADEALQVLVQAQQAGQPDWRLMSTQGTVLDQLSRHEDAQKIYTEALKLAPDEPSILSNLGLSLALSGDLARAEQVLTTATQHPRATPQMRENLALVLGLQGRFAEAEKIAAPTLPASTIASNTSYLKGMMNQPDRWSQLQTGTPPRN
ncbi:MAG: tetratricopeptide repeat protein [Fimbriimonadaceae bacterium]|nr:tetratricopeptide repeat protein [Alphaproteobacteria bacterium]